MMTILINVAIDTFINRLSIIENKLEPNFVPNSIFIAEKSSFIMEID